MKTKFVRVQNVLINLRKVSSIELKTRSITAKFESHYHEIIVFDDSSSALAEFNRISDIISQ